MEQTIIFDWFDFLKSAKVLKSKVPKKFSMLKELKKYKKENSTLGWCGAPKVGKLIDIQEVRENVFALTFKMFDKYDDFKIEGIYNSMIGYVTAFGGGLYFGEISSMYYDLKNDSDYPE